MSTLSNVDIEKELINGNISIFPFSVKNIKGASYNLTVSKFAYVIPEKPGERYESAYQLAINKVVLPPKSTTLIATDETIWVSAKIAGTYHSKVGWVSEGLGHIGTTLDPTYLGVSIIAVHNHSDKAVELKPEEDTFVSIVLEYLKTDSSDQHHDNSPGRPDLINKINPNQKDHSWIHEDFKWNKELLRRKIETESADFKQLKNKYELKSKRFSLFRPHLIYLVLIVLGLGLGGFLASSQSRFKNDWWYSSATFLADKATTVFLGALIAQLVFDTQRKDS